MFRLDTTGRDSKFTMVRARLPERFCSEKLVVGSTFVSRNTYGFDGSVNAAQQLKNSGYTIYPIDYMFVKLPSDVCELRRSRLQTTSVHTSANKLQRVGSGNRVNRLFQYNLENYTSFCIAIPLKE
jgi:hypothetical protein